MAYTSTTDDYTDPNTGERVDAFRAYQIKRPQISPDYKQLIYETIYPDFHSHPAKYGRTFESRNQSDTGHSISGATGSLMAVLGAYNINVLEVTYRPVAIPRFYATQTFDERREYIKKREDLLAQLSSLTNDPDDPEYKEREKLLQSKDYEDLILRRYQDSLAMQEYEQPALVNIAVEFKAKIPGGSNTYTSRWIKYVVSVTEDDYLYHEEQWVGELIDQVLNARERLQCPYFWDSITDFERGE